MSCFYQIDGCYFTDIIVEFCNSNKEHLLASSQASPSTVNALVFCITVNSEVLINPEFQFFPESDFTGWLGTENFQFSQKFFKICCFRSSSKKNKYIATRPTSSVIPNITICLIFFQITLFSFLRRLCWFCVNVSNSSAY